MFHVFSINYYVVEHLFVFMFRVSVGERWLFWELRFFDFSLNLRGFEKLDRWDFFWKSAIILSPPQTNPFSHMQTKIFMQIEIQIVG
jgi:hypothetical protein